jgi:hypothetical protein
MSKPLARTGGEFFGKGFFGGGIAGKCGESPPKIFSFERISLRLFRRAKPVETAHAKSAPQQTSQPRNALPATT